MNSKAVKRIGIVFLMMFLLTACGSNKSSEQYDYGTTGSGMTSVDQMAAPEAAVAEESRSMEEAGFVEPNTGSSKLDSQIVSGKKLIKRVALNLETKEFDHFISAITAQIESVEGYIENSQVSGNSYGYESRRYSTIVARIPSKQLDGFLLYVGELGNVTFKQESVEDVTLQYVDIESHKKALLIEQERLLELLEAAESVEDIISIETRLSSVRYELESYESQIRLYDNLIDYSTVTISIEEVERVTPVDQQSMWDKIASGFVESLYNIGEGLKNFVTWFFISLPYLFLWAAVIAVIILVIRIILRKTSGKKIYGKRKDKGRKEAEDSNSDDNQNHSGE